MKDIVLNEGLEVIGLAAFSHTAIESIILPSTLTELDLEVFIDCSRLREIVLNEGLKKIERKTFGSCSALQRIHLPSTIIEIVHYAFHNCSSLEEVELHDGIKKIDQNAFNECQSLQRFAFPSLSTRLYNIIQAGQRGIKTKIDSIPALELRGGGLFIPAVHRQIVSTLGFRENLVGFDRETLSKIRRLITYYEIKEATSLFELALWKSNMDQEIIVNPTERTTYRTEVPGPVKDVILQHLCPVDEGEIED